MVTQVKNYMVSGNEVQPANDLPSLSVGGLLHLEGSIQESNCKRSSMNNGGNKIPAEYYIVDAVNDQSLIDFLYLDRVITGENETVKASEQKEDDFNREETCSSVGTNENCNNTNENIETSDANPGRQIKLDNQNVRNDAQFFNCDRCNRYMTVSTCPDSSSITKKRVEFSCKLCSYSFDNQILCQEHEAKIHAIKSDPCSNCITSLCKQSQVKNSKGISTCILCDKHFKRMYDLKIHMSTHLDIKAYVCDVCGKRFSHSSNLFCHKRLHTGEKPYVCKVCSKRFRQVPALIGHELSHSSGISCTLCNRRFKSISVLVRHIKSHAKNVDSCRATSKSAYKMAQELLHKQSHDFYCNACGERFSAKKILNEHVLTKHADNVEREDKKCRDASSIAKVSMPPEEESEDKQCDAPSIVSMPPEEESEDKQCDVPSIVSVPMPLEAEESEIHFIDLIADSGDTCGTQDSLPSTHDQIMNSTQSPHGHASNHISLSDENSKIADSGVKLDDDAYSKLRVFFSDFNVPADLDIVNQPVHLRSNKSTGKSKKDKFVCDECGKRFPRQWHFKLHLAVHDSSLRRYSCSQCGEKFAYNSSLQTHIRKHSGVFEKYACLQCDKTYKSKEALRQHNSRVHKGKVNHACPYCDKQFFGTTEYKYHVRLHKKESPYMCSSCGKRFSHVSHLHRHERIHLGIRPHTCSYCSKTFIQASELSRHTKRHAKEVNAMPPVVDSSLNQRTEIEIPTNDAGNFVFITDDGETQIGVDYLSILNVDEDVTWTSNVI